MAYRSDEDYFEPDYDDGYDDYDNPYRDEEDVAELCDADDHPISPGVVHEDYFEPDDDDGNDDYDNPYRDEEDVAELCDADDHPISPGNVHEPLKAAVKKRVSFNLEEHLPVPSSGAVSTIRQRRHVEKRSPVKRSAPASSKKSLPQAASATAKKVRRRGNGDILGVLNIGDQWLERIPREHLKADAAPKFGILKLSNNPMLQLTEEIKNFENLKELHASQCGIQRLPAELAQLKSLTKLCLFNNPLKSFPMVILSLEAIRELNLGQCDLEGIPGDIVKLKELEKLHLRGNRRLRRITVELFGLAKLRELNVGECSLTTLPPELSRLKQLEKLHLFGNSDLHSIPEAVFALSSLREINAAACDITGVPADVEKLSKLETLLLRDNQRLRHVPPAVFSVSTLKELSVANCGLSEIPEDIGKLKKLERLHIFGNKELQALPNSMFTLHELRVLNACNCNLKDLTDIGKLKKLKILYLRGNGEFHQLPRGITELTDLKELNLGQCGLADVNYDISTLSQIKTLHLFGNPDLREPSNSLERLTGLEELSISQCSITNAAYLPLKRFTKLKKLHMSGCRSLKSQLTEVSSLTALTELDVSGCDIDVLPFVTDSLVELAKVNIGSNNVQTEELDKIFQLKKLEELGISECNLTKLPDVGEAEQRLKKLDVHGNSGIELPPSALRHLEHLQELNLSHCQLLLLPDEVYLLKYLVLLNVSENKLSTLPPSIEKLTLLKVLNISANIDIVKLPPAAMLPKTLRDLDISCCPVSTLESDLVELTELEVLAAQNTGLTEYPNVTLQLKNLRKLDVSNRLGTDMSKNVIKDLPVQLVETVLKELLLEGNPMTKPPLEIIEQGMHAIRTYLTDSIPGSQLVCAETVNMLGDTGAGKTSIVQSLRARRPHLTKEADRTRVMEKSLVRLLNEQFVNINDFGGHDIYQTVLPMFLPPKGLGILTYNMADSIEEQKEKVRRWITTLLAKSPGIRLIVAGTHADVISNEDRARSEQEIQTLVKQKFEETAEELKAHISKLTCEMRELKRRNATTDHVNDKLRFLEETLQAVQMAERSHVSLSCKEESDSGLSRLHDVVSKTIKPPDPLPACWCHVMKDIIQPEVSGSRACYLEWKQVVNIFYKHIPDESSDEKLKVILRYLVATSQIIWLENHPTLGKLIFHRIDLVLAMCKAVLHHDVPANGRGTGHRLPDIFKADAEKYSRGHLSGTFLHHLLEGYSDEVAEDTMTDLMLQFNLISRVNEGGTYGHYIVPSRLEDKAPEEPIPAGECRLRTNVLVRMQFFSSTMPLALFETSLASVLTWVYANDINPECWKHGVCFRADGVTLSYLRNGDTLELKAAADGPRELWGMLHPVLKTVAEHVINLWKGALPQCGLVCPGCRCCGAHPAAAQPYHREVSLEVFTSAERFAGRKFYCKECKLDIPRSLIFACLPGTVTDKECDDTINFKEKLGEKCPKYASDGSSAQPQDALKKKFLRASSHLIEELDKHDAEKIADDLLAAGLDETNYEEFMTYRARKEKVRFLFTSIIQRKPGLADVALQSLRSVNNELADYVENERFRDKRGQNCEKK